jgi:DNA replication factor GINS
VELEDLRLIVFNERESGKLSDIQQDVFSQGRKLLDGLYREARSIDNFLTDRGRNVLNESVSVEETLKEIVHIRSKKILKLAVNQTENSYVDRDEIKRMLPAERAMFEEISAAIERCRVELLSVESAWETAADTTEDEGVPATPEPASLPDQPPAPENGSGYALVRILEDIDSFMGIDGRIYNLQKEDLITLPEKNAEVLKERNIALNIRISK